MHTTTAPATPTSCTRDEVFAAPRTQDRTALVTADGGGYWEVLSFDGVAGFAHSPRTGMVVRFRMTGRAVRSGVVRVRICPAVDTGDLAGTIEFPEEGGFGGVVSARVLAG